MDATQAKDGQQPGELASEGRLSDDLAGFALGKSVPCAGNCYHLVYPVLEPSGVDDTSDLVLPRRM
jgi:hypothetical protein